MGRTKHKHYSFDLVLAMALFCLFTVVALLLAGIGSRVYASAQTGFETDYLLRTTLSYVTGKVRSESAAQLTTRTDGGMDALVFTDHTGDGDYETWIYFTDGKLCEQYLPAGSDFTVSGGTVIFSLDAFTFSLGEDGQTLTLYAEKGGVSREMTLCANRFAEVDR